MVIDCCVNVNLNVIFGKSTLLGQVDDVGFHVHDVNLVREWIEILESWPHGLDVLAKPFIDAYFNETIYPRNSDRFADKDTLRSSSKGKWFWCFRNSHRLCKWTLGRCHPVPYFPHSFRAVSFVGICWEARQSCWNPESPVLAAVVAVEGGFGSSGAASWVWMIL